MTLALRNVVLALATVVGLLFCLLFFGCLAYFVKRGILDVGMLKAMYWSIAGIGVVSLFSVAGGFGFRRLFRRSASLEIFFFLVFVTSLAFDALKILHPLFMVLNLPNYYGGIVTRVIYFGYFFALLCIFASSLYSGDVHYQKMGTVLGLVIFFSFTIAHSLPIDVTVLRPNLLFRVGGVEYVMLVRLGLEALTVFGFGRSAFLSASSDQWYIFTAILFVLLGRDMLFFFSSPGFILLGVLLLISGALLFSRKSYMKHLWI